MALRNKNNKKRLYTIVDLFSGVGGLSLGFVEKGFEILLANDNDKDASKTFIYNHPNTNFYQGDVRTLDSKKIKKFIGSKKVDVLVGGIPCQSFSMVGFRTTNKESYLVDPRHFLFKEFVRVAKLLKPKIVIIENVKGILSAYDGKIKNEIVSDLESIGYKVDYQVLNAADYGVAQVRERTVFMGNNMNQENIFPQKTHAPDKYVSIEEIFKNIPSVNHEPRVLKDKVLERVQLIKPGQNWRSLPKHLQTGSKHSGAYGRLDPKKPSRTLTTRFDTPPGGYVTHPLEDRAITVREGARIQSFPDNFKFIGNIISQYRQVGNAVAVGVSRALASSVKKMFSIYEQKK